jgi:thioredoxin reductase (NADPH)
MQKYDLRSDAFPKLSEAEMDALGTCPLTVLKQYKPGEKLFRVGDCDCNFFVVKSGEIEVVDESGDTSHVIAVLQPGEFTGEIAQMTGSPSLVEAIARRDRDVYELSPDAFRQLLNHHPQLGDVVLQAFIARRQLLREPGNFTGLRVIGSRYSQDTFRIREFLAKNLASSWAPDRPGWLRQSTARPRACAPSCSNRRRPVAKPAAACESRIT